MSPSSALNAERAGRLLGRLAVRGKEKKVESSSQPARTEAVGNGAAESYSSPFVRCV